MSTTTIYANGSHWIGEAPDSIEQLLAVLAAAPLNSLFEKYGNFILPTPDSHTVHFWGNFATRSHVFHIGTDDPVKHGMITARMAMSNMHGRL
jgi:hypothetical protein